MAIWDDDKHKSPSFRQFCRQNTDRIGHSRETSPKVWALDLPAIVQRDVLYRVLARVADGVHYGSHCTRNGPEVVSEGENRPVC